MNVKKKMWIQYVTFKNEAMCRRRKIFILFSLKKKRDGPRQGVAQGRVPSPIYNLTSLNDSRCHIFLKQTENCER